MWEQKSYVRNFRTKKTCVKCWWNCSQISYQNTNFAYPARENPMIKSMKKVPSQNLFLFLKLSRMPWLALKLWGKCKILTELQISGIAFKDHSGSSMNGSLFFHRRMVLRLCFVLFQIRNTRYYAKNQARWAKLQVREKVLIQYP